MTTVTSCRHPFNCEPPPETLMQRGWLTPVSLHYVRNHGPVPRLEWGKHRCSQACTFVSCLPAADATQGAQPAECMSS